MNSKALAAYQIYMTSIYQSVYLDRCKQDVLLKDMDTTTLIYMWWAFDVARDVKEDADAQR